MRRRVFLLSWLCLTGIGSEVLAQGAADLPRVAILSPDPPTATDPATGNPLAMFLEALHERGYVDGRNIRLDFRFAENRLDLLPGLAAELVNAQPDVIYTYTTAGALATARATTSMRAKARRGFMAASVRDPRGFSKRRATPVTSGTSR